VHVSAGVLRLQFVLASRLVAAMNRTYELALATRSRAGVARYRSLNGDLAALLDDVEGADAGPALPLQTAIARALRSVVAGTPALDLRGEDEP
jgi:hypothetical protein